MSSLVFHTVKEKGAKSSVTVTPMASLFLSCIFISLTFLHLETHAKDTLTLGESINDGETLVSAGEIFELGFFSPGGSKNRYVGIRYYNFSTDTILWVANRESPVPDASGSFSIASDGNLVVLDRTDGVVWSSSSPLSSNQSSTAQLLDTGNLMLTGSNGVAWQSFDNPTDTYLPGMKVGLDLRTNVNQLFTSWRSSDDPAAGNFSLGIDPLGSTQIVMWGGGKLRWRSGPWNEQVFIGIQNMVPQYIYGFKLSNFLQEQKMYFYYSTFNSSHRYTITPDGAMKHFIWSGDSDIWALSWAQPVTSCEFYNTCGGYGSCSDESAPICSCLRGFRPASEARWRKGDWSDGCVRNTPLQCGTNGSEADGFLKMERVKLPDLPDWRTTIQIPSDCEGQCLGNCSCKAYAFVTGIGCLIWGVELIDIHIFSSGGEDMYIRLAGSEFDTKKKIDVVLVVIVVLALITLLGFIYLSWKCKRKIRVFLKRRKSLVIEPIGRIGGIEGYTSFAHTIGIRYDEKNENGQEFPLWNFDSILVATGNFSDLNLIGQGGFGPVYKGILSGGQEVAVKRLSKTSGQGLEEFKNEIILIAKLQHRNLVRLLGCCIHQEEKILIYEYMPNKSLDAFLFDTRKKGLLNWSARYNIIEGVARGLLYLHRDSRLRVIHRDLKASNILLDEDMNPKISDFGMARIFGKDDNETNTKRVAGTYGYMSPEYAMHGLFSVKSDVFSFGVLLLEIISGNRNSNYQHPELPLNLLTYAWKLWDEDNAMEFIDETLRDSCSQEEASKCVNIGLLCVQDRANDRPTMSSVVIMLESGTVALPGPKKPTVAAERSSGDTDSSTVDLVVRSGNSSITLLSGR